MPYLMPEERIKVYRRNLEAVTLRMESLISKRGKIRTDCEDQKREVREMYSVKAVRAIEDMDYKIKRKVDKITGWIKHHRQEFDIWAKKVSETNKEIEAGKTKAKDTASSGVTYPGLSQSEEEKAIQRKVDAMPDLTQAQEESIKARNTTDKQSQSREELESILKDQVKRTPRKTNRPKRPRRPRSV